MSSVFEELKLIDPNSCESRHLYVGGFWKKILIGGLSAIIIVTCTALLTYYVARQPICKTGIAKGTVSSSIKTSTTPEASTTARSIALSSTHAPSNNQSCFVGFHLINGKCWKLLTWWNQRSTADRNCWLHGGSTLFSIRNQQENDAIVNFVSEIYFEKFWLGLICEGNTTASCIWDKASGTAEGYDNFADGHPNVTIGKCVCIIARGPEAGKWKSCSCNDRIYFVCELPPTIYDKNCDKNYNNHCYLRFDKSFTVAGAQKLCEPMCAKVVSITSPNENRYIQSIYNTGGYITLGAAILNRDEIHWLDGSPATYNNIRNYNKGTCAIMNLSWDTGYWNTTECSRIAWFLCKRPAGIVC